MNNARSLLWLSIILALSLAAHFFLHYKGGLNKLLVQRTHLLEASAEKAIRVNVTRDGYPTSQLIHTRRWRLAEPYAAIADEQIILNMLDSLMTTEITAATDEQELMRLGRTRDDFGLENPRLKISVATETRETEIAFGNLSPSGEEVYASVDGENAIYVVATNAFIASNLAPEGFRRRRVFSATADSALTLDIKQGEGSFMRFVRDGNLWQMIQPEKKVASEIRVKSLLDDVLSATAVDFIWPTGAEGESTTATSAMLAGYGLDAESAVTITMKCLDGFDRQISLGKTIATNLVYALVQNSTAIVTVPLAIKESALEGIATFTDTRLFPVATNAITRVSIADGDTTYLLAKSDDGAWQMESPVAAATDSASIATLLSRIAKLTNSQETTNGLAIAVSPGEKTFTVYRQSAIGNFRLENLRSREIINVDPENIRRLVATKNHDENPSAIVYDSERRAWNIETAAKNCIVANNAVATILKTLNPLRSDGIVKLKVSASDLREYGLDNPCLTLAIDVRDENAVRRNILIGKEAPNGGRYATLGAADAIFILSQETCNRLAMPLVEEQ